MPVYKFEGEINLNSISSPGTWLCHRNDVYVNIEIFNLSRRSKLTDSIFPICFNDKLYFDKTFFTASCPKAVCDMLEQIPVTIEFRQITDVYLGGTLLAYCDTTARDLFNPCPAICTKTECNREILLRKTCDFPGISPSLDISLKSVIKCFDSGCSHTHCETTCCCTHHHHHCSIVPSYCEPTLSSILRSRSRTDLRTSPPRASTATTTVPQRSKSLSRSASTHCFYDRDLNSIKDRTDRYWHLYRYWQTEYDRARCSRHCH